MRDCNAPLSGIDADWKWASGCRGEFSAPLPGISWAQARVLAAAQGVFPELDAAVTGLRAYSGHYGLQKYAHVQFRDMDQELLVMFDNHGEHISEVHRGGDREFPINFVGQPANFPPFVNAMWEAPSAEALAQVIDQWMHPDVVARRCADANNSGFVVDVDRASMQPTKPAAFAALGTAQEMTTVGRVYAILLLAFNNSTLKQRRNQIQFVSK